MWDHKISLVFKISRDFILDKSRMSKKVFTESQFLTLTFDKKFDMITPRRLLVITISELVKRVRRFSKTWRIVPELTSVGKLHYHILCKLKEGQALSLKLFRGQWHRECGFTQIENAKRPEGVREYLNKDDTINGLTPDIEYVFPNFINPKNYKEVLNHLVAGDLRGETRIIARDLKKKGQKDITYYF